MKTLQLEKTPKTPLVKLDSTTGKLIFQGRSIPEDAIGFYEGIMDWIVEYAKSPATKTVVEMRFEYFNTASSKCILDVLKKLESFQSDVFIEWYFEEDDEDMQEAGEDYHAIINLPFKIIETEEL